MSLCAGNLRDVLSERAPGYSELIAGSTLVQDKSQLVIAMDLLRGLFLCDQRLELEA